MKKQVVRKVQLTGVYRCIGAVGNTNLKVKEFSVSNLILLKQL